MANPVAAAVRTAGLAKRFGRASALEGPNLEMRPGEVHGFLGPNGAGKSTTIRILLGLVRATAGRAEVLGRDPWHDAADPHRRLAYVPATSTPGRSSAAARRSTCSPRSGAAATCA